MSTSPAGVVGLLGTHAGRSALGCGGGGELPEALRGPSWQVGCLSKDVAGWSLSRVHGTSSGAAPGSSLRGPAAPPTPTLVLGGEAPPTSPPYFP